MASSTTISLPNLDPRSRSPLHRQLYEALRLPVLEGQFKAGMRMLSVREMANHLATSRTTVHLAYEQLIAEGYLEARQGSGTFVSSVMPEQMLIASGNEPASYLPSNHRYASELSGKLVDLHRGRPAKQMPVAARVFTPGLPDDSFPRMVWQRLLRQCWRDGSTEPLDHAGDYKPLREAIATHVGTARGVRCIPNQVILVTGSQQGLDLAARVLLNPGEAAWIEDPGYDGVQGSLIAAGVRAVPVPVDDEGLSVATGNSLCPQARLACVTPSHQFPLGMTMSLQRRIELLDWASRSGGWILEDDYDSEYRYAGRPLTALQALDREERVIYAGTFSKVMFPGLRLAYLVVPVDLIDAFTAMRFYACRQLPLLEQQVIARFMQEGHLTRHIRRMRTLYGQRQQALIRGANRHLEGLLTVLPTETGMHLVGWLPQGVDDRIAAQAAWNHGVSVTPLSAYSTDVVCPPALVLGYAAASERAIGGGVRRLRQALEGIIPT